ncbi:MAG: ribosome biogenesis GTP-binding protein YihA/YsxC [Acidobacteriaceae bacterium]
MKLLATFLKSAVDPDHFPPPDLPEIAFAGRSNVGKSSLINTLLGTKLARVSSSPGRTQMINFFDVTRELGATRRTLRFADLPGYGYAKVSRSLSAEWPRFIEPYLQAREPMRLCVCLVDSNIPPQEPDTQLLRWLQHHERPFLVVATKADRLGGNQLRNSLQKLAKEHEVAEVLPVSAKTKLGFDVLWQRITSASAPEGGNSEKRPGEYFATRSAAPS